MEISLLFLFCTAVFVYSLSIRGIAENSTTYRNRLGVSALEKVVNILFPSNFRNRLSLFTVYTISTLTYVVIVLFLYQRHEQGLYSFVYALLFIILVSSAVSDLYTQMISDEILYFGYSLIPITLIFGLDYFLYQLIFVLLVFAVMWVLNWLGFLGGGDVQLLVILGFFLTKEQFLTSILVSAMVGVIFACIVWSVKRSLGRFAYLPSVLAGVAVTLLFDLNLFSYYFD